MSDQKSDKKRSGNRRRRRRRPSGGGNSDGGKSIKTPKDLAVCPLCEQVIRDILTAIIISPEGTAAHFDCVVKKITSEEELRPKEKICYLGAGEFGIVRFNPSDSRKFSIRKRIRYETKEHIPEWRRQISEGFTK